MKIIIAEDDGNCQEFIRKSLGPLCREMVVTDTLEGLKELLTNDMDLVWLDLVLHDANGDATIAFIPQIRQRSPNATVIVATGWNAAYEQKAIEAGADVYVQKGDLKGFKREVMLSILSKAAMHAMSTGIDANKILQRVAAFIAENT